MRSRAPQSFTINFYAPEAMIADKCVFVDKITRYRVLWWIVGYRFKDVERDPGHRIVGDYRLKIVFPYCIAAVITFRCPVTVFFTIINNRNSSLLEGIVNVRDYSLHQIEQPRIPITNDVEHRTRIGACFKGFSVLFCYMRSVIQLDPPLSLPPKAISRHPCNRA